MSISTPIDAKTPRHVPWVEPHTLARQRKGASISRNGVYLHPNQKDGKRGGDEIFGPDGKVKYFHYQPKRRYRKKVNSHWTQTEPTRTKRANESQTWLTDVFSNKEIAEKKAIKKFDEKFIQLGRVICSLQPADFDRCEPRLPVDEVADNPLAILESVGESVEKLVSRMGGDADGRMDATWKRRFPFWKSAKAVTHHLTNTTSYDWNRLTMDSERKQREKDEFNLRFL